MGHYYKHSNDKVRINNNHVMLLVRKKERRKINMKPRGMFKEEYKEKYGLNSVTELRLIPYFQYLCINQMSVDPAKINEEERSILRKWEDEEKIRFSDNYSCSCSKEFWNWMNAVLWDSYVLDIEEMQ